MQLLRLLALQQNKRVLHQMLERSIISEDVIDVFDAMGIKRPEISILSEEFLKEVQGMAEKNLSGDV